MKSVVLLGVGDTMLGGRVSETIINKGENFVFGRVKEILPEHDIFFLNLEMPFSEGSSPVLSHAHESFVVPFSHIKVLKYLGVHVANIGTNHLMDFGEKALLDTIELLSNEGIHPVGGGKNENEARKPVVLEIKGIRLGFLGYCKIGEYTAKDDKGGAAPLQQESIMEDVEKIKNEVDYVILSLHWGTELSEYPSPEQVALAHSLIDAGVDVILGHHPHVLQGIERYNSGLIFYSLGNFIFDNKAGKVFYEGMLKERSQSVIAVVYLNNVAPPNYDLIPVYFEDSFRLIPAEGERKEEILKHVEELSRAIEEDYYHQRFFEKGVEGIIKREVKTYIERMKKEKVRFLIWALKNFKWRYIKTIIKYMKSKFASMLIKDNRRFKNGK